MRDILFRGKDVHTKEWRYGGLIDMSGDGTYFLIVESYPSASTIPLYMLMKEHAHFVVPETIGQYTGLKDKNGVKIFEGDIADHVYQAWPSRCVNRGVIFYDEECVRFAHKLRSMNPELGRITTEAWEVIGNVYDNPELLD